MTEVNYAEVQPMIRRKDGDDAWRTIAAALAKEMKADLVTGDPEFKPLDMNRVW